MEHAIVLVFGLVPSLLSSSPCPQDAVRPANMTVRLQRSRRKCNSRLSWMLTCLAYSSDYLSTIFERLVNTCSLLSQRMSASIRHFANGRGQEESPRAHGECSRDGHRCRDHVMQGDHKQNDQQSIPKVKKRANQWKSGSDPTLSADSGPVHNMCRLVMVPIDFRSRVCSSSVRRPLLRLSRRRSTGAFRAPMLGCRRLSR